MKTKHTEQDKVANLDTDKLFDFTQAPASTDSDAFQAYYRMRRIAKQLARPDLLPDGKVMTESEVAAVLEQAPKKNAAVTGNVAVAGTEEYQGGSVAPEVG